MLSQNNYYEVNRGEILYRVVEKIKTHYQPEKVLLFGSYGWGNPTEDSNKYLFIVKKSDQKHRQRMFTVVEMIMVKKGVNA